MFSLSGPLHNALDTVLSVNFTFSPIPAMCGEHFLTLPNLRAVFNNVLLILTPSKCYDCIQVHYLTLSQRSGILQYLFQPLLNLGVC